MRVAVAGFPAMGIDADTVLTGSAPALRATGLSFAVRYLSLGATESEGDLSAAEVAAILGASMALMPVQHARAPGWTPMGALGKSDGTNAGNNAAAVGIPPGATVWCDFEVPAATTAAADAIAYINAWAAAVKAAGYDPGLYVGAGTPLNPGQLYALAVDRYWKSFSSVAEPATCGFCMIQLYKSVTVAGVDVDVDVTQYDYLDRLPNWVVGP